MPRRGFLNGVPEWLRFGLGVADQGDTATPALEDTMKVVVPWDPLRAGLWLTKNLEFGTVPAGSHSTLLIIGGRTGTYITSVCIIEGSSRTYQMWFDVDRETTTARFPGGFTTLNIAQMTAASPPDRSPSTIWEEGHILAADLPDSADAGVGQTQGGGTIQQYSLITPFYVPPGAVWGIVHPNATSNINISCVMVEP